MDCKSRNDENRHNNAKIANTSNSNSNTHSEVVHRSNVSFIMSVVVAI